VENLFISEVLNALSFMEQSPFFLQLSQSHLQTLSVCPRKFQYSFLEQLMLPRLDASSEQQQLGTQFHRLMQQYELNLDIQPLLQDNPKLQEWFQRFRQSPPPMILGSRQSEHQRTLTFQDVTLVAIYDLLIQGQVIQGQGQAQIIDWKTYRRPPNAQTLKDHWQTRLYPFILTETSDYLPEQLAMTYWFAEPSKSGSHWIHFPYSNQLHQQTQADLEILMSSLQSWIQSFAQAQLPQAALSAGHCISQTQRCAFVNLCDRFPNDQSTHPALTDIRAIAELSLDRLP
jgi:PD-(D/E)XK nuclease superfamily